jgi:hypothetical protein
MAIEKSSSFVEKTVGFSDSIAGLDCYAETMDEYGDDGVPEKNT